MLFKTIPSMLLQVKYVVRLIEFKAGVHTFCLVMFHMDNALSYSIQVETGPRPRTAVRHISGRVYPAKAKKLNDRPTARHTSPAKSISIYVVSYCSLIYSPTP